MGLEKDDLPIKLGPSVFTGNAILVQFPDIILQVQILQQAELQLKFILMEAQHQNTLIMYLKLTVIYGI